MDDHALIKERELAHLAKQILDNPLLDRFDREFDEGATKAWIASKNPEYREDLWRFMQVKSQFMKFFNEFIRTGQMAEMQLAEMQGGDHGRASTNH